MVEDKRDAEDKHSLEPQEPLESLLLWHDVVVI